MIHSLAISRFVSRTSEEIMNDSSAIVAAPQLRRHNTLNKDHSIIICYHPKTTTPFADSKPIGSSLKEERYRKANRNLTATQTAMIQKLRNEDPFVWTIGTLAKLFNVMPSLVSRVAPIIDEEKRNEVKKKQEYISKTRYHKRVKYLKSIEEERQAKLKEALATIEYKFPGRLELK